MPPGQARCCDTYLGTYRTTNAGHGQGPEVIIRPSRVNGTHLVDISIRDGLRLLKVADTLGSSHPSLTSIHPLYTLSHSSSFFLKGCYPRRFTRLDG